MGVTKSNKNNISSPKGNSLALFVDYNDGNLKLKDINGNVENFTAYAGSMPVGVLQMEGGVPLDSTLRPVQDQNGNNSPLFLSTNSVTGRGTQGIETDTIFGVSSWRIRGGQNTVLGFQIGENIVDSPVGSENTIVGNFAFGGFAQSELVGNKNVAIGYAMGSLLIPSNENIAIGEGAMEFGDFQSSIAIGTNALTTGPAGLVYENVEAIAIGNCANSNNDTLTLGNNIGIGGNSIQNAIVNSTTLGYSFIPLSHDSNSVYLGWEVNQSIGPTQGNVGIGYESIRGGNVQARVGIGYRSGGYAVAIGGSNGLAFDGVGTAIGFGALQNSTRNNAFAIGLNALNNTFSTSLTYNTAVGLLGGALNATGIGRALSAVASNNTLLGKNIAQQPSTSASRRNIQSSTLIGQNILYPLSATTSTTFSNTVVGISALRRLTTGSYNTAIGHFAAERTTTGGSTTAIGHFALFNNSTGASNTAIGYNAGFNLTTGLQNVIVGANDAVVPDTSTSTQNSVLIGAMITAGSNFNTLIGQGINTTVGATVYGANVVLGKSADVIAASTFSVGSASVNAGTVNVESLTSDTTWTVRINGTEYKMLLKA